MQKKSRGFPPSLCNDMLPSPLSHWDVELLVGRWHMSMVGEAGAAHIYYQPSPKVFLQVPGPPRERHCGGTCPTPSLSPKGQAEGFPQHHRSPQDFRAACPQVGAVSIQVSSKTWGKQSLDIFIIPINIYGIQKQGHVNSAGAQRWAGTTANSLC